MDGAADCQPAHSVLSPQASLLYDVVNVRIGWRLSVDGLRRATSAFWRMTVQTSIIEHMFPILRIYFWPLVGGWWGSVWLRQRDCARRELFACPAATEASKQPIFESHLRWSDKTHPVLATRPYDPLLWRWLHLVKQVPLSKTSPAYSMAR